jgi:two-component system phosphate regulon sensor histidine kinase PhoR
VRRGEQMRVDFIANVSHELRTPLASLAGFIETLQGQARDDAAARERFLGIMADQTSRMGRLVEDLLSLSQIELDEHNRPAGRVDIPTRVDQTLEELEPVARERSVTLIADLPEGLPPVNGDGDQVAQVLRNLIENAIKYGREGGEVRIAAARVGDTVSLTVQDNGEGIPREHLHRLTERFYRVDAARSRRAGGTGLGLAIVKHIVNRHRGRLAITSTPGEGSRFTVFWPVLHTH